MMPPILIGGEDVALQDDLEFVRQMALAREIMRRRRTVLRALAGADAGSR